MSTQQIRVTRYKDYRLFLRDYYHSQKKCDPKFSYRVFSKRAGLNSPNYLQLVISGKRNLTIENIHQFSHAIGLTPGELNYFEPLVLANQSKDPTQIAYYKSKLKNFQKGKSKEVSKSQSLELLDHWAFPGVVAALAGREQGATIEDLQELVQLSDRELSEILEALRSNGIVELKSNRFFLKEDQFVFYFKNKVSNRFQRFQEAQLEQSRRALNDLAKGEAKFFSHAFTIEKKNQVACYERIRTFLNELAEELASDSPEKLMQLNIQLFGFNPK